MSKTRHRLANALAGLSGKAYLDPKDLDQLEEALLQADLGWDVTDEIMDELRSSGAGSEHWTQRFMTVLKTKLEAVNAGPLKPVVLIIGVNGTGKTTSAAKLAGYFSGLKEPVMLVAADTYRAAAVEQIRKWSERLNVTLIANQGTKDPAAVTYDGVQAGLNRQMKRIIVDTAGRLHTSRNLMQELEKIHRVTRKVTDQISVLITLDANTGQNGITQVREFSKYLPVDGVILTKMDGTARGGIAVPIMLELQLPVNFIGVGEQVDDLIPFELDSYLRGLIGIDNSENYE